MGILIFNDMLKSQMPSDRVEVVRFVYDSTVLPALRYPDGASTFYIVAQDFANSPALKLPPAQQSEDDKLFMAFYLGKQ